MESYWKQRDRQDSQNRNSDRFCRLPVVSAQCIIATEKYPDAGKFLNYDDDDDYSKSYCQFKAVFRALANDYILQPYISDANFRSSNAGVFEFVYFLFVSDIIYQQNFTASHPIKVELLFDGVVPRDMNVFALVLASKLV